MRILKSILLAPVRVIVFFIQFILTVCVVIFSTAGGIISKAGEVVGGFLILGSILCAAVGKLPGDVFIRMFLGGVAFAIIPIAITKLGEEGIFVIKGVLGKI